MGFECVWACEGFLCGVWEAVGGALDLCLVEEVCGSGGILGCPGEGGRSRRFVAVIFRVIFCVVKSEGCSFQIVIRRS